MSCLHPLTALALGRQEQIRLATVNPIRRLMLNHTLIDPHLLIHLVQSGF